MKKILKLTQSELNKIIEKNLKESHDWNEVFVKENKQLRLKIGRLQKSIYHREKSKWCNLKEHSHL